MKVFIIIIYSIVMVSFFILQGFISKHIIQSDVDRAKKSAYRSLFIITFGLFTLLTFIANYTDQYEYMSNLNETQNFIFILYMLGLLTYQIFETYKLRRTGESLFFLPFVSLLAKAFSVIYMLAYLDLYTLL